ncbi:MAG: HAMP domain-containing sensor histidine kinase [Hespellia sp.]|nr:HAMP domain-containing sensor histidine kinase [Hespellia sp.]
MRKQKKSGSVFRQLVGSYVLFSVLLVAGIYACLFGVLLSVGKGNIDTLAPYKMVDANGNVKDISNLKDMGGWIEKLDSDYRVQDVYGQKQDQPEVYTQEQIYEYLITDNIVETDSSASTYRGFMRTVKKDGETVYYLVKMPRDVMTLTHTYNVGNHGRWEKLIGSFILLFLLFFAANCFLMSSYLSRRIRKPLKAITEGMEQVIEHGVDQVRIDFKAQREFDEIRDNFNTMTARLEEEKREKRVNEMKKDRMLLELSHDIKTPVATIKSYANALEEGLVEREKLEECYRIIDQKAERVDVLVNEMFLLLKLDNPSYTFDKKEMDLCELMRSLCAFYYEEMERQGIEMHIDIPENAICAEIDRKEFARVIENLLENIVKYNQDGQGAWITVSEKAGKAKIIVLDDGQAIAEELIPILFDPFVRGDEARTSKGGTGLGLAIARKIVRKLDGDFTYCYAEGKNQFTIQLPVDNRP